ncbi:hypothetical protein LPJ74_001044 [Coemansia sp. RSA 1843]|nr:hypothetical protein LPJ74_001044 [Coemansia sp. RSA 1843]
MTTVQPLESYYSAIRDAISGNHLSLAAEKAIAGLRDHPGEAEFIKIEIVALIKQEQSRKALDAIRKARSAKLIPAKVLQYEEAYCYFMLGSYDEARVILKKIKPSNAVDCLLAQIAYKREQFSECVNIYKGLLSAAEPDSQEYNDLLLNLSAASAAKAQQDGKDSLETASDTARGGYEFLFNSATRLLACDKVHEAIKLLNDASENAKEGLAALGWSDGDIQSEIGPINAQKAVALQYLGKNSEARSIYSDLLSQKNTDRIANDIATHNMATISVCGNVYSGTTVDKAKRVLQIPGHSFGSLTCAQQALMHYNMAVVLLHQNQYFSARRVLCLLGKRFPNVALPSGGAASAIASLKVGSPHKALYEFLALSHVQAPIKSAFASLAAAQIAIGLGKPEQGASVLHEWLEKAQSVQISDLDTPSEFVYHYFGISMLMSWLSSEGDLIETTAPAASTAAEHLYSQFTKIKAPSPELLVAIGDCLEYSGDTGVHEFIEAFLVFVRDLRASSSPERTKHPALLLDRLRVMQSPPMRAKEGIVDYDPTRKADSERWIPLQQRSYYKPRGRNRKQQALRGGAQGGILEAGSGLGGTGSARISGKAARSAQQTQSPDDDSASDAAATTTRDVDTGSTKQKTSKPKPKGNKGKGKAGANSSYVSIDMVIKGYGATLNTTQPRDSNAKNKATVTVHNTIASVDQPTKIQTDDGKTVIKMGGNLPSIYIDGPYSAPTEHFFEYEVGVLIAAGIGVTPAASVLRSVYFRWLQGRDKLLTRKIYLFWAYRDIGTLEWFKDILIALEEEGLSSVVEVRTYYTGKISPSPKPEDALSDDRFGTCASGTTSGRMSYVGRPDFDNIFEALGDLHSGVKIGTFFCGPKPMARKVRRLAHKWDKRLNKATGAKLDFHSEVFF